MCKHGETEAVKVKINAKLSHTGKAYWKNVYIDKCIATIVRALQRGNIDMLYSCCGHGERDGEILLVDGRILSIKKCKE